MVSGDRDCGKDGWMGFRFLWSAGLMGLGKWGDGIDAVRKGKRVPGTCVSSTVIEPGAR